MVYSNHEREVNTMSKTIWIIIDENDNTKTQLTYYHFGKTPQFPTWYMEEDHSYLMEMVWNMKLACTLKNFFKCLFKSYVMR